MFVEVDVSRDDDAPSDWIIASVSLVFLRDTEMNTGDRAWRKFVRARGCGVGVA